MKAQCKNAMFIAFTLASLFASGMSSKSHAVRYVVSQINKHVAAKKAPQAMNADDIDDHNKADEEVFEDKQATTVPTTMMETDQTKKAKPFWDDIPTPPPSGSKWDDTPTPGRPVDTSKWDETPTPGRDPVAGGSRWKGVAGASWELLEPEGLCSNDGGTHSYQSWWHGDLSLNTCKEACEDFGTKCIGITSSSFTGTCNVHVSSDDILTKPFANSVWITAGGGGVINGVQQHEYLHCYRYNKAP